MAPEAFAAAADSAAGTMPQARRPRSKDGNAPLP